MKNVKETYRKKAAFFSTCTMIDDSCFARHRIENLYKFEIKMERKGRQFAWFFPSVVLLERLDDLFQIFAQL